MCSLKLGNSAKLCDKADMTGRKGLKSITLFTTLNRAGQDGITIHQ